MGLRLLPLTCNLVNGGLRTATTAKLIYQVNLASLELFQNLPKKFLQLSLRLNILLKHCWHHGCSCGMTEDREDNQFGFKYLRHAAHQTADINATHDNTTPSTYILLVTIGAIDWLRSWTEWVSFPV